MLNFKIEYTMMNFVYPEIVNVVENEKKYGHFGK